MSVPCLEIEAAGSHHEISRQIGEAARHLIVAGIAYYEESHEQMGGVSFADAAGVRPAVAVWRPAASRRDGPGRAPRRRSAVGASARPRRYDTI